jgi:Uma2 family endonuclease
MVLALPIAETPRPRRRYLRAPVPLEFPEEELRMPDGDEHFELRILLWQSARLGLGENALVSSDQFVYFDPTNPGRRLSPDLGVRVGTPRRRIKTWKTWEWGPPQVGVEIVSASDAPERVVVEKLERYRQAGIIEVVRFDPRPHVEPLRLWDLVDGDLVERDRTDPAALLCDVLGLYWCVREEEGLGRTLRLARDREGHDLLLTPAELSAAQTREALAIKDAAEAATQAALAAKDEAMAATNAALARVAELEAELRQRQSR